MKYRLKRKALVLDHDDTVVASTLSVHYPAFVKAMEVFRPQVTPLSLSEFQSMNLDPGLDDYYREVLKMSEQEKAQEYKLWRSFADQILPEAYEDIHSILLQFQAAGGLIFVSSLNHANVIYRDYQRLFPSVILSDVFCADQHSDLVKPNPEQLLYIMKKYRLQAKDLLMVDDLHYGLDMAKAAGVDFAYAQYSQINENNHKYFKQHAQIILEKPSELKKHILVKV